MLWKEKGDQIPMSIDTKSLENQKNKLKKGKERLIDLYLDEEIDKKQCKLNKINLIYNWKNR